ncbi:MAG: outer membrane lipid asymmetry maintenance protein MlaD [Candidatus Sumerlaeota bacterium]|nr:outer membrane lipid asymmetry maintenance protein MlaD [Candidatus Sumerlaeota bacterium]
MKKESVEISVGIFVLIGLACVAWLAIKLGKMEWLGGDDYRLHAKFASVSGLKKGAIVDMAGVQIGQVDRIGLDPNDLAADVWMRIRKGIPVAEDSMASIRTSGLIGDKYVKIEPGGSDVKLKDGDRIRETESAVDLEEVIGKYAFGDVSKIDNESSETRGAK